MSSSSSASVTRRVGTAALLPAGLLASILGLAACSTGPGASQATGSASASRSAGATDPQELQGVSINVLNASTTDLWWREAEAGTNTAEWQAFQKGETVNHDTVRDAGNAQNQIEIGVGSTSEKDVINLLSSDLPKGEGTGGVPLQICDTVVYGTQPRQSLPNQSCKGRNYDVQYTVTVNADGGQVASWSIRIKTS